MFDMKRIYLFIVPLLALLCGCEGDDGPRKGAIWDIPYPRANFVILDAEGNNIFKYDPEAIYDLEVEYKDKVYRYDEDTRALPCEPFGIRSHFGYPYMFTLGDFDHDEEGSYIVRFRDQEWLVEYKYNLRWKHYKPIKDSYIKIGSKEVTAIAVDKYDTFGDGTLRDIYAIPLHYAPEVKEWDIPYPRVSYAILDSEGNNIFRSNSESMNDVVITYNGETYRYEGETRALLQESLALTTDYVYPYRLNFGDFDHNDKGSYTIEYNDQEWFVEFEYKLRWEGGMPVIKERVAINGEVLEPIMIDTAELDGRTVDIYALPLYKADAEWDITYPTATYAVLDSEGNNIFRSNSESMKEFEISYNGETYRYEGETRALLQEQLALTTDHIYPYRLNFGDFDHNDKGSYVIKFGEKTWAVEFEYTLEWVDDEPVLGSSLKVDGEEAEMQVIEEQWKIDDYNSITVYAIPLHLE